MSLPFLLIYLTEVRAISLTTAGLVLSTVALASFIGNPLGGWLSDPLGPRTALMISLVLSAVGVASFAVTTRPVHAFVSAALLGLGNSIAWPAFDALLASLVAPEQRSAAFSVRNATLNGGMAAGAVIAGFIVDTAHPNTFQLIFVVDALTLMAFLPVLLLIRSRRASKPSDTERHTGYRVVLRDRLLLAVVGLSALIVTVGYGQYHAAFPAWSTRDGGIPTSALGACFAANAIAVALFQLPMLRMLVGRRRTAAVSLACLLWALAWLLALLFGHTGSGWLAIGGFIAVMLVFGLAETALAPTLTAIVNDIAPDHLRGRYNGISALGWTTGFLVGPAVAGFALDADAGAALMMVLIAACLVAAVLANKLGERLPASANLVTA
jgi:MFS family permease